MSYLPACDAIWCHNKASYLCLCNKEENYLCWNHYIDHITKCSYKNHETMQLEGTSSEIYDKIQDKLNVIIEETNKVKELVNVELGKLEDYYRKAKLKATKTKKTCNSELQAIIDTCGLIFEKMKKPIIKKDYYTQLEYLLLNKNPTYSDTIINQIEPPIIQEIIWDKNMWKNIRLKSPSFSHLLSAYNTYGFTFRDGNLIYNDFVEGEKTFIDSELDPSSRCMLIGPNSLLITGGMLYPKRCEVFDIEKQCLVPLNQLNHERFWHCCTFIKGFPAVIGGRFNNDFLTTVEILKYGKWEDIPPLNYARSSSSAYALFGKVYVCGGNKEHFCEIFDEEINIWKELVLFKRPTAHISPGLIGLYKDVILIFGGYVNKDSPSNEAFKYYINDKEFIEVSPFIDPGKFSWGSHVIKNQKIYSGFLFERKNGFLTWELNQEIIFA